MVERVRLNKVIELLEHGQAVFSCGTVANGNFDEIAALGQSAYDMIIIETEHVGFDFPTLRHSLQYLLNRKRMVEKGNLQPDVVPLVRIPPYTRERNEWVIPRWCTKLLTGPPSAKRKSISGNSAPTTSATVAAGPYRCRKPVWASNAPARPCVRLSATTPP